MNTKCIDHGYARAYAQKQGRYVHRLAYADYHGLAIGDLMGKVVMHLCDNPRCINPQHLKLGSQAENLADMRSKGRSNNQHGELSESDKERIRDLAAAGVIREHIAKWLGVSPRTAGRYMP
jgi:hypothetical protein